MRCRKELHFMTPENRTPGRGECRECRREYDRARREERQTYDREHREERNAWRRADHAAYPEKARVINRRWIERHPEYQHNYYLANRDNWNARRRAARGNPA